MIHLVISMERSDREIFSDAQGFSPLRVAK
jgi:hypothetical protein